MKRIALAVILVALIAVSSFSVALAKPAVPPARDMGRGVFIDYGYSSPPWYPPEEETDSYKWAPRLHWATGDLPVDCTVYTAGAPEGAFAAVSPAFEEWDEHTSTELYGTVDEDSSTPPPGAVHDEENTVSWGTIDGPGGVIGMCYYWYYVNTKEMVEFDIVFDIAETWSIVGASGAFDVQNIATHELGHTLVLQDLRSPRDGALTMHAYTWLGDIIKRTLGAGDILGLHTIYGE